MERLQTDRSITLLPFGRWSGGWQIGHDARVVLWYSMECPSHPDTGPSGPGLAQWKKNPDIFHLVSKDTEFVSNRAHIKPVLMVVQTLGTTGTGGQTHLILARLDTKVSVF